MAGPSAAEVAGPGSEAVIYLDASALAKLYVPEPESERLDEFLRGRRGLIVSELAITEVLAAVARRKRDGALRADLALEIRDALLEDAESGAFERVQLSPALHRDAERLLIATDAQSMRVLDALHVALALSAAATHILTFDRRLHDASVLAGLRAIAL